LVGRRAEVEILIAALDEADHGVTFLTGLTQYRPALAAIVPGWTDASEREPEISPLILGEALLRLMSALPGAGALLVLEDLQFADPETLAIVEYLADNVRGGPVRCLATVQETEPSITMDLVRSVHARRAATLVEVGRLTDTEVGEMAAACLDQVSVPEPVLGRLLAECDGLPFAVEELLAAAIYSGELVKTGDGWAADERHYRRTAGRQPADFPVPALADQERDRLEPAAA
jgi:hypothetical protein